MMLFITYTYYILGNSWGVDFSQQVSGPENNSYIEYMVSFMAEYHLINIADFVSFFSML